MTSFQACKSINRRKAARATEDLLAATADLRAREAHVNSILQTVPDAMIVIDERGVVQSYSAAAQRIFGWSAPEITGRNVSTLMPAPFRQEHDGYLDRYQSTGEKRMGVFNDYTPPAEAADTGQ